MASWEDQVCPSQKYQKTGISSCSLGWGGGLSPAISAHTDHKQAEERPAQDPVGGLTRKRPNMQASQCLSQDSGAGRAHTCPGEPLASGA